MASRLESTSTVTTAGGTLAILLARVVVPLWFLVGAVLKLADMSPTHLPVPLIKWAGALGVDLLFLLQFSIAVELIVAAVMWLLPGLARPVGMAMLAAFVPILVADVAMGASSCGCFGAIEVHPGITLTLDVGFLLGLWLLGRNVPSLATGPTLPTWRVVIAGVVSLASVALAFGLVPTGNGGESEANPGGASNAVAMPADGFYLPAYDQWIGRQWSEIPISQWITGDAEMGPGPRYVLFYRKDCEHCHELMEVFFAGSLAVPTTAVAVPERDGFPTAGVMDFVCDECRLAELPQGVDWFLQTPVLVKLLDGQVECAAEVTAADPQCIEW